MNNTLNDLITRGAVCDMLHEEMGAWGNCADEIEALLKANDALWELPAVDAVEVVRCKDCKHWEDGWLGYCTKCHTAMHYDGFCSYGERREDDGTK